MSAGSPVLRTAVSAVLLLPLLLVNYLGIEATTTPSTPTATTTKKPLWMRVSRLNFPQCDNKSKPCPGERVSCLCVCHTSVCV